jgi:hypothetical protein
MRTARAGEIVLHGALAVFLSAGAGAFLNSQPAWAAQDEAKTTDEPVQEAPKLPANQLDAKALKTLKTPFSTSESESPEAKADDPMSNLKLTSEQADLSQPRRLNFGRRLVPSQLFLPGRMILGKMAEFTIKGKPGSWAALAMADKDTGAKPILGHKIRLGPDRKVVAAGQIPESGLLSLDIGTPIEGDLIGEHLYFEAALWSKPDMSDLEIAAVVPSESQPDALNGVQIAADTSDKKKRGIRIVPASGTSIMSKQGNADAFGLESGKP